MEPSQTKPVGRIQKGWLLTKAAWQTLRLDKELALMPVLSLVVTLVSLVFLGILFIVALLLTAIVMGHGSVHSMHVPGWFSVVGVIVFAFTMTLIANFFGGAIIAGANERFQGGDPTISSSLGAAWRKLGPLAGFSLMMATIGLIFQLIQERVPFAGKIAVWILNGAWSLANVFALPAIMLSEENLSPIEATRRSVATIRKVWGESVVADLGISVIALLTFVVYVIAAIVLGSVVHLAHAPSAVNVIFGSVIFLGLIGLVLVFSVLTSIVKAALYYYATTGEAPSNFNDRLLHAAMTPKKARKIFA